MSRTFLFLFASLACLSLTACDDDDNDSSDDVLIDAGVEADASASNDSGIEIDASTQEFPCDPAVNYGWRAAPANLVNGTAYQPKAIWTGAELAVQWVTPKTDNAPELLWFGRFDREGHALAEPIRLGNINKPVHDLAFTGTQFVSTWRSEVISGSGYDGLRSQTINLQGQPVGNPYNVPLTFDATNVAVAFAVNGTGMMIYDRGVNGQNGIHVRPISEDGTVGNAVKLTANASMSPAIAYGDGLFGVAWLDRTSTSPMGVTFATVDSDGTIQHEPSLIAEGAAGNLHIAFNNSTFALGMSRSTSDGLLPFMAMVSSSGNTQTLAPLLETSGYILITDVTWMNPDSFGVAWQEKDSEHTTVGVTRVGQSGQIRSTIEFESNGAALQGLNLSGNTTRTLALYTEDPASTGSGYSNESRTKIAILGTCGE